MRVANLRRILADRAKARSVVLATNLRSGREELLYPTEEEERSSLLAVAKSAARRDLSTSIETDEGPVFLHVFNPPLRMVLIGAVHISQPLARIAALAGYSVTVVDPRRAFASEYRFPGVNVLTEWPDDALTSLAPDRRTAVVALTHDPKLDDPALSVALRSPAFYVGALGSRKTHAARKDRLAQSGFSPAEIARVRGPVGLEIGARSPSEIAVAVLAEVTQALRTDEP